MADTTRAKFVSFSAVLAGIKEIREVMGEAERLRRSTGRRTIVFIDEIHRFNKAQQDAFLPRVEAGDIVLIGATTENPSFELNNALLSRCRVYTLKPLTDGDIEAVIRRALSDAERGLGSACTLADDALAALVASSDGDARRALNLLEIAVDFARDGEIDAAGEGVDLFAEFMASRGESEHAACLVALTRIDKAHPSASPSAKDAA